MKCKRCGAEAGDARYCPYCGSEMSPEPVHIDHSGQTTVINNYYYDSNKDSKEHSKEINKKPIVVEDEKYSEAKLDKTLRRMGCYDLIWLLVNFLIIAADGVKTSPGCTIELCIEIPTIIVNFLCIGNKKLLQVLIKLYVVSAIASGISTIFALGWVINCILMTSFAIFLINYTKHTSV